jgi:hypothetical protein
MTILSRLFVALCLLWSASCQARTFEVSGDPANTFDERIQRAVQLAMEQGGEVILPRGRHEINQPIRLVGNAPAKGVQLRSYGTTLFAGENFPENSWMIEAASPEQCVIGDLTLWGDSLDANNRVVSRPVRKGLGGVWFRPGWDVNANSSFSNNLCRIRMMKLDIGMWIGSWEGPDFRGNSVDDCVFDNCNTGVVFEGANITSFTVSSGTHTANGKWCDPKCFARIIMTRGRTFESGTITDPWGKPYFYETFNSPAWKQRIGPKQPFSAGGGGPTVVFEGGDAAIKNPPEGAALFLIEGGAATVRDWRCEGTAPVARVTRQVDSPVAYSDVDRFRNIFEDVTSHYSGASYVIDGGRPVVIRGGHYNGSIPKPDGRWVIHENNIRHNGFTAAE